MFSMRPRGWMWILLAVLAVLAVAIASGSMTTLQLPNDGARASETPASTASAGQLLPIEQRAWLGDRWIYFEVARTQPQQMMGLMFRSSLSRDRGMFFPFSPPRPVRFWMRNVEISLDMLFVRDGQIVSISADVPPCTTVTCQTYGPNVEVDGVIELAGGTAERFGIAVGDRVEFEPIDAAPPDWVDGAPETQDTP